MQKVMVFIDFENFNISLMNYYSRILKKPYVRLDYNKIPTELVGLLPGVGNRLIKTFLFAPKPDDFLLSDPRRKGTYDWICGLKNQKYFTVIEGQHVARATAGLSKEQMDINDPSTYHVTEKGTDVNIATHIITKAFMNAFDTAVILSGDSDYMPVYEVLNTLGKTTVAVGVMGQILTKLSKCADDTIILSEPFFDRCLR
jgi:uncharacterized LabA/DUF88 family protein